MLYDYITRKRLGGTVFVLLLAYLSLCCKSNGVDSSQLWTVALNLLVNYLY